MQLALRLARGPRKAYEFQKNLLWNVTTSPMWGTYMEDEAVGMDLCGKSEDYAEAAHAFLEKRPPNYKGQ